MDVAVGGGEGEDLRWGVDEGEGLLVEGVEGCARGVGVGGGGGDARADGLEFAAGGGGRGAGGGVGATRCRGDVFGCGGFVGGGGKGFQARGVD